MRSLLPTFRTALESFASSTSSFQILRSIPPTASTPPKTLYVLDSSFNPPTRAHLHIAVTALLNDERARVEPVKRLLLLLATQNADKAPKPASFEQRLVMMSIFAEDLVSSVQGQLPGDPEGNKGLVVEVGVIKSPLYLDKTAVIEQSGQYGKANAGPEQVHLIGFDSLIRLFDTKYYPPHHTLHPLEAIFSKHRIRATKRTGGEWGDRRVQDAYLQALANGDRENEGAKRQWATRIDLVDNTSGNEEVISSTKVRNAVKNRDGQALNRLVTDGVKDWVLDQKLYLDE
ncbi:MAG: hypothetical protein Q9195_004055 [Heterodermia aff. obscurata]